MPVPLIPFCERTCSRASSATAMPDTAASDRDVLRARQFLGRLRQRPEVPPSPAAANVVGGRNPLWTDRLNCPPCPRCTDIFELCSPSCALCLMRIHAPVEFVEDTDCGICGTLVKPHHPMVWTYESIMFFDPPVVLRQCCHELCDALPALQQLILVCHRPRFLQPLDSSTGH